ncbi:MAG: hydrogenase iron-sulfur subunit [Pseudodesulfovibrio sp.]|uniref:Methyl-viologen-reducing hydrogenase delta subunit n=1 Tax=Pseudodesulfovibrio aespoeensis (strain ATCC 700646 / DSM 10631 / Aspo-2) TaxID=643562 RepID=E6VZF2_PSEA9|nr:MULTISPECIES: hydrogenase iron-sulfur subunit [Pseudodesulfovibrio]MBU4190909.1 hydrogenase iron-sulfur subunit [Pseudomonadota bacterium]ADU64024.1 methyl-viologen-reducing hydrogenase delta subunit [Pseudodesulfovibrio aespoeensis Aspo-2]MBU4245213.1 hydrogenase iron-sulfur subunit [Pseudomonadota bacterium]MBU4380201.1 hydrogenase iron-sulfur subunit [Pseudomonadota bacterium]MBU4475364.1 hydrogenase iron-sulfur subunit [Pseudomonadota bacterium]
MAEKLGVYICGGCDIGASLDVDALAQFAAGGKHSAAVAVAKSNPVLCSPEGKAQIEADVAEHGLDGVVCCACSPRAKWDVFKFGSKIQVERVNLREHCVWSFQNDPAFPGQMEVIAKDYINMGISKLTKSRIPNPEITDAFKTVLVVGGGYAGLNAALNVASLGYPVVLVEKSDTLGGKAATMYKSFPLSGSFGDKTQEIGVKELIADVQANDKIKVITGATVESLAGAPAKYKATIAGAEYEIGAVVMATGWVPGKGKFLAPLGYGKIKNVVTTAEFEAMAKNGGIKTAAGKTPSSVAFIVDTSLLMKGINYDACGAACAAPEDMPCKEDQPADASDACEVFAYEDKESAKHLAYSSELTSLVALKQANYVRELAPDAVAYIIYDHMMVPGINEKYYQTAQDDPGVMLTKGTVTAVEEAGGEVVVKAKNTLLGDDIAIYADIVVVPTAIVPTTAADPVMNFVYRQGPAFPDLELFDGFADSNYICFPYETRRTGVYAAGCVRQPMGLGLAAEDAAGAALKAIQCIESANRGMSVHPRSGDLSFPEFNFMRCTQCKRCTEECPFGALDDDEKGTPMPNPTRCRRCGTCMGACPERVISFANYGIDQIGSAIKEVKVPDTLDAGGPRVIVLVCENDAYPALDMAAMRGRNWSPYVRFLSVRCLGSVNAIWVADAMSKGVDGLMLLGCKFGDDYQCHFVKGSELCNRRKENIAESLGRLGVEPERVEQYEVSIDMYDKVPDMIDAFVSNIVTNFGPNPFKGY